MSKTKRYLNVVSVLFRILFPLRLLRWLLWLSVLCFGLAQILVSQLGWDWINVVAMLGILLVVFISLVAVPSQVIALASSRPITLLGNSRRALLIAMIAMGFLFSVVVNWSMSAIPRREFSISLLVVWLMASVLLQLGVWICSRWPGLHGFIYVLNSLFTDAAVWLDDRNPLGVLAALIACWVGFSYWWLHWKPAKYQSNNALMSGLELQKRQSESAIASRINSGRAQNWLGSRLFGAPDSWRTRGRRMLDTLIIFAVFPIPFFLFMGQEKFIAVIQYGAVVFLLVVAAGGSQAVATNFFRNLRCIWLCSPGSRHDLFAIAWGHYWRETSFWALMMIAIAMVLELTVGIWRGAEIWLLFLVSVLLVQMLIFYVVWFVYQKREASVLWCNWVCVTVFLCWLYSICATGLLFPLPFDWQGISTLWVWLPELIAIALLHKTVRTGFFKMDLLKVA